MKDKAINDAMNSIENRIRHVYNQGYEDGKESVQIDETTAYKAGLEAAWALARKVSELGYNDTRQEIFGMRHGLSIDIIKDFSVEEVEAKIKEYEEKQKRTCDTCQYGGHTLLDLKKCVYCDGSYYWTPKQKQEERGCKTCAYSEHGEDGFFKCHAKGDCLNHEKWASKMTLDEAIKHCEEVADSKCDECGAEHRQLAEWLMELKQMKGEEG